MAVVIGSASIRITAISADLKRDINRDLNAALRDVKIDINPLQDLDSKLRQSELELIKARQAVARFEREAVDAEDRLGAVRRNSAATADEVRDAELRLSRALAEGGVARDRVRTITASMTREQERYRQSTNDTDRDSRKLHSALSGISNLGSGIGRAFGVILPSMHQASFAGTLFTTVLRGMAVVSVVALGAMGALAGAGGLGAVASALATVSGAALILPAALGAAGIAVGALIVGFQGMGAAFKAMGDPAKFAEAIKELSPNARAFAIAVHDMVPAFKELRTQVQDRLFAGLGKDFSDLGKIHLPIVQKGLSDMAVSLNESAKGFVAFARDKQTVADLATLFKNSSVSAHILSGAVQPLLGALRDIGTVGSTFLPALSAGLAGAAQQFGAFIANARETGKLQEWISAGLAALGDLFAILGNIGSIIGSVFTAGQSAGAGFLNTAKEITGQLAAWAKSGAGQSALGDFFTAARQAAQALLPIVGSVVELIGHQLAPILAMIATTVGPSVKIVLDSIGDALDVAKPGIEALARGFADFLRALAPALPTVGELARVLGESLGKVLTALGPVIAKVAGVFADQLAAVLPDLAPAVIAIAEAFGDLLVALAPLIPSLAKLLGPFVEAGGIIDHLVPIVVTLVEGFADLMDILQPLIDLIADSLTKVLDGVSAILPDLVDAFLDLIKALIPIVEALLPPLVDIFVALLPIIKPIVEVLSLVAAALGPVLELLGPILDLLSKVVGFTTDAVVGLLEVVGMAEETTTSFAMGVQGISTIVDDTFGRIGHALIENADDFDAWGLRIDESMMSGAGAMAGFTTNTTISMGHAGSVVESTMNWINRLLFGIVEPAGVAGSGIGGSFARGLGSELGSAVRSTIGVVDQIGSALQRDYSAAGTGVMSSFARGIRDGIPDAVAAARQATGAIAGWLPRSPAQFGPFSGRGWTLYRGMALMEGLAAGIAATVPSLTRVISGVTGTLSGGLLLAQPGVSAAMLPSPSLATATPRGGDGAMSPTDLHETIIAAIQGWQVVVSARETASKVNRVNKDNATR